MLFHVVQSVRWLSVGESLSVIRPSIIPHTPFNALRSPPCLRFQKRSFDRDREGLLTRRYRQSVLPCLRAHPIHEMMCVCRNVPGTSLQSTSRPLPLLPKDISTYEYNFHQCIRTSTIFTNACREGMKPCTHARI